MWDRNFEPFLGDIWVGVITSLRHALFTENFSGVIERGVGEGFFVKVKKDNFVMISFLNALQTAD